MRETREKNRKIKKCRYCQWKNLPTWTKIGKEKPKDKLMKNLLTQWELRRKTNLKLELWQSFTNFTIKLVLWLILMASLYHLANTLTNTDDETEDFVVHCQACIYESGSPLPISYSGLKIVQLCQTLICYWLELSANHLSGTQSYPLSLQSFQNHSRSDHYQVQLVCIICQGFQLFSHISGETMTC